jgi:hypothetical protein
MLSAQEFWGSVLFMDSVALIYMLRRLIDDAAREGNGAFRWGDKQRHAIQEVSWWASHEFCLAIFAIGFYVFLCWVGK